MLIRCLSGMSLLSDLFYQYTDSFLVFFFFNDTATTEIYTLSLHDALPISTVAAGIGPPSRTPVSCSAGSTPGARTRQPSTDRKSTRLNSSHGYISYAVFCF